MSSPFQVTDNRASALFRARRVARSDGKNSWKLRRQANRKLDLDERPLESRRAGHRLEKHFAAGAGDGEIVGFYPGADRAESGVTLGIGPLANDRRHRLDRRQLAGAKNEIAHYPDAGVGRARQRIADLEVKFVRLSLAPRHHDEL